MCVCISARAYPTVVCLVGVYLCFMFRYVMLCRVEYDVINCVARACYSIWRTCRSLKFQVYRQNSERSRLAFSWTRALSRCVAR